MRQQAGAVILVGLSHLDPCDNSTLVTTRPKQNSTHETTRPPVTIRPIWQLDPIYHCIYLFYVILLHFKLANYIK